MTINVRCAAVIRVAARGRSRARWEWVGGAPSRAVTPPRAACAPLPGTKNPHLKTWSWRPLANSPAHRARSGAQPAGGPGERSAPRPATGGAQRSAARRSGGPAPRVSLHLGSSARALLRREAPEAPPKHRPALSGFADLTYPHSPAPDLNENPFTV